MFDNDVISEDRTKDYVDSETIDIKEQNNSRMYRLLCLAINK